MTKKLSSAFFGDKKLTEVTPAYSESLSVTPQQQT